MILSISRIFILSRLLFLLFAVIAIYIFPLDIGYIGKQSDPAAPYLVWVWANFDGRHFLDIATLGYQNFNFAFFPLYPLFIFIVQIVFFLPSLYVGILISLCAFFLSLVMVYKIIRLDFKEDIARLVIVLLCFFPLSFFYQSVYSDALFLLFSTSCLYFARLGGQKTWILAGAFGGLAVLTRFAGIALIPALVIEWYLQNRHNRLFSKESFSKFLRTGFIAVCVTAMGMGLYIVYLQLYYGDWLLFQKSFSAWSQQRFILPPQTLFRYFKILAFASQNTLVYWVAVLELVALFSYLGLAVYVFKKVRVSYGVFMIVLLSLVAFTGTFAGTPRYILHLFPGFLAMALLIKERARLKRIVFIFFIILGFILTALFTRGYFIT